MGTGEIYLDSLMKDLRELYAGVKGVGGVNRCCRAGV